jgi:hypothetical protein
MFDFSSINLFCVNLSNINFDESSYLKYEKIKYILKIHYVINYIIVKIKIIVNFNKMSS